MFTLKMKRKKTAGVENKGGKKNVEYANNPFNMNLKPFLYCLLLFFHFSAPLWIQISSRSPLMQTMKCFNSPYLLFDSKWYHHVRIHKISMKLIRGSCVARQWKTIKMATLKYPGERTQVSSSPRPWLNITSTLYKMKYNK